MAINPSLLTAIGVLSGTILGTFLSPFLNHQLTLRYNRREFMFKKKLEYFEQVALCLEENIKVYKSAMKKVQVSHNKRAKEGMLEKIKSERKRFKIMASPLYFNVEKVSLKIREFVNVEKEIFQCFEALKDEKNGESFEKLEKHLEEELKKLVSLGNEIIIEMQKELGK